MKEREKEREREGERRVDGFYPDGISSLAGRRIGIDRSPRFMEINRRRRLATLSHLCKSGRRLIDKIFKSSEIPKVQIQMTITIRHFRDNLLSLLLLLLLSVSLFFFFFFLLVWVGFRFDPRYA